MTGILIFRVVAEPRNSGKSAKSCEIHNNTQNAAKFGKNLIKYMSVQHIWNFFLRNLSEALPNSAEKERWIVYDFPYLFLFFASSCRLAGQQFLLVSGVSGELKYDLF